MTLTSKEIAFYACLDKVNDNSLIGSVIARTMSEGIPEKVKVLIDQLKSQAKDNPASMIKILGMDCYQQLIAL